MACDALTACLDQLPFRMCLAASMCLGLRFCGDRLAVTRQALKQLEEMSTVPAKLLLVAGSKVQRLLKARTHHRRDPQLKEGYLG